MDAVSFAKAAKQEQRLKKIIANPDSNSGVVTVPQVIAAGETITIPAGRMAVLPNLVVDDGGELVVDGKVFIPSGSTFGDLDDQIALKADTSYVNAQLGLKQNVLVANDAGVKTALNASGTAPVYACRAWVNFNGTGTVAIRASGNVSSITDNGTGNYKVNFTTAMPDANYAASGSTSSLSGTADGSSQNAGVLELGTSFLSTSVNVSTFSYNNVAVDRTFVNVVIFR